MEIVTKGQTTRNFGSNIAYFAINIAIGIFLVPYFINTLGIAAYGLIPLATSLIGYIGLLTNSINSAVSRHLTIDAQSSDREMANRTFNSAFFGISKVVLIAVPMVLALSLFAPSAFNVPPPNALDATWLFVGIGFAFLIRAWSSNFTVTLYASNRLDQMNLINLINVVVQVATIVIMFTVLTPSLMGVGFAYLLGAGVATAVAFLMYKRTSGQLSISYRHYDGAKFREMAQMGGWIIVNDIGALLLLNIDLIVVNYLYGNTIGGEYAIAYQWVGLLRGLALTFVSILGPIILISYANGQRERILSISKSAVKLTGLGIALPIGLICGFAPSILGVWVGERFMILAPLMILLTFHLVINTAVVPLFQINVAHNKVRLPAVVTLVTGLGNIMLAIVLAWVLNWGIYGVAVSGMICLTLKNLIFTPLYASVVMSIPKSTFYTAIIPGALATAIIALASLFMSLIIETQSIVVLTLLGGIITLAYASLAWRFLMSGTEKALLPIKVRPV